MNELVEEPPHIEAEVTILYNEKVINEKYPDGWIPIKILLKSTKANSIRAKLGFNNMVRLGYLEKRNRDKDTYYRITQKGKDLGLSWRNLKL